MGRNRKGLSKILVLVESHCLVDILKDDEKITPDKLDIGILLKIII